MSDMRNFACPPNNTALIRSAKRKQKKKNNQFRKKMQYLETKGYVKGKHGFNHCRSDNRHDQAPRQNGAYRSVPPSSTRKQSLFHVASTSSASHCSSRPSGSTHNQPPFSSSVNSKDSHENQKEPVNTKLMGTGSGPGPSSSAGIPTKYLAIDCEMVGTGPKGAHSQLARCSIVSYEGDVVYDKFILPPVPVTDYRTRWSGIRRNDLNNATPYLEARKEILRLLRGKVVIGHAIHNDYKVLDYSHPAALTRDTSRISLLNLKAGFAENECASLKRLTKAIFSRDIQTGRKGHSSVEDARATMELYKVVEVEWERTLASKSQPR
ncbi:interferon-stimulated 20 kDa exonuclease-like 2 [Mugil cephalus]|uniref:interferon-stimulated 20 kDa exonuclease-like 2 n=1 Tax=Mugil cephalus TaxID=48193 RepID=UPI001FB5D625|nr:interferon-stimulated 20 kDa exonuclease-like 2 [Mugil cephalus]XP_047453979.1 interferon-stimulated 20 kDa exonuclease-like 2 [Mugil cephalus]XP_047453980.1 interferon-stimulated 20 kDa exonuclease-like 2 [Mugil cephalus]